MTTTRIILVALLGLAVYVLVGWAAAVQRVPRAWRRAREVWHWDDKDTGWSRSNSRERVRATVRNQTYAMFAMWPVYWPGSYLFDWYKAHPPSNPVNPLIDRYDPERNASCPAPPEPTTLLQPSLPSPDSSLVTKLLSGLTRSERSKMHSR